MTTDMPLELHHMDLFGPIAYISIGGSNYCLVIGDDYSRFTGVFFLQEKSQTQVSAFRDWGVPRPTSECAACPSPDGSSAWASAKGGKRGGQRRA
jgi:hypothetical protein